MKTVIAMPLAHQRGGSELMLTLLLKENLLGPKANYSIMFFQDGPMVAEVESMGYPVTVFPVGRIREFGRQVRVIRNLSRWLKQEKTDVVMAWMSKAHVYTGPAAVMAGIPSVWWQHGISDGHWLDRCTTIIPTQKVFCCSKAAQATQMKIKPQRPTCVVYPAVDLARFSSDTLPEPKEARRKLGLPDDGPLIGIVCRLQRWKGVHIFLRAAAQVAKTNPDARFVVVGGEHPSEPDYPTFLKGLVRSLKLDDKVSMVGFQGNSELWMQAMDVIVHASISPEPFGMVVIEALALGKIVIASKAGGPLEVIAHGKDGYLTEPGDPDALANAMRLVLSECNSGPSEAAMLKAAGFGTDRLARDVARNLENLR